MATLFDQEKNWRISLNAKIKRFTASSLDIGNFVADAADAMAHAFVLTYKWLDERKHTNEESKRADEKIKKIIRECMLAANESKEIDLIELTRLILDTAHMRKETKCRKQKLDRKIRSILIPILRKRNATDQESDFSSTTLNELLKQFIYDEETKTFSDKGVLAPAPEVSEPITPHDMIMQLDKVAEKIKSERLKEKVKELVEIEKILENTLWVDTFFTWFKGNLSNELSKEIKGQIRGLVEDFTPYEALQYFFEYYKAAQEEKKIKSNRYLYSILATSFIYSLPLLGLGLTLPSFIALILQSFAIVWVPPLWVGLVAGIGLALIAFSAFYYRNTSEANPELMKIGADKWEKVFQEKMKLRQQVLSSKTEKTEVLSSTVQPKVSAQPAQPIATSTEICIPLDTLVSDALKSLTDQEAVRRGVSLLTQEPRLEGGGTTTAILHALNAGDEIEFPVKEIEHEILGGYLRVRVIPEKGSIARFSGPTARNPILFAIQPIILPPIVAKPSVQLPASTARGEPLNNNPLG